jgi:hypothetical protein
MAAFTKFYLSRGPAGGAFTTVIDFVDWQGGWHSTSNAPPSPWPLLPYKAGLVSNGNAFTDLSATTPYRVAYQRWVTDPLTAQTISGTINVLAGVSEDSAATEAFWRVYAYVTAGDTSAVRGELLDYEESTAEWPTTPTAQALVAPQTLTSTAIQDGDRVVIELGTVFRNAIGASGTHASMWTGSCTGPTVSAIEADDVTAGETTNGTLSARAHFVTFSNAIHVRDTDFIADGDLIVGNGDVLAIDAATGALKGIAYIVGGLGSAAGAVSADGLIYVTNENHNSVRVYNRNLSLQAVYFLTGGTAGPHAMAVLDNGDLLIGNTGDGGGGPCVDPEVSSEAAAALVRLSSDGTPVTVYTVAVEASGTPAVDVASDQRTVFYTSLGRQIKRFDIESNTQLADFATLASDGGMARGLKVLPDGGVLVADTINIKRLNAAGAVVQTYTTDEQADWGTITLDATAETFWSANTGSGEYTPILVHFNLESGAVLGSVSDELIQSTGLASQLCSGGILLVGGYRDSQTPPPTEVGDCPGCGTGPGGAPPETGFGGNPQPPILTPRIVPPGGEAPSYAPCSTGGDPATATDPTDPQSLTDAVSPVVWIQIRLPDATVLRYNGQGIPFTSGNGAVSTPRVTNWGPVSQTLADDYGSFEALRTTVTLADTDRVLRGYLANAATRHIDGSEVILYVETRANAALGLAPRVLARGVISNWKAVA